MSHSQSAKSEWGHDLPTQEEFNKAKNVLRDQWQKDRLSMPGYKIHYLLGPGGIIWRMLATPSDFTAKDFYLDIAPFYTHIKDQVAVLENMSSAQSLSAKASPAESDFHNTFLENMTILEYIGTTLDSYLKKRSVFFGVEEALEDIIKAAKRYTCMASSLSVYEQAQAFMDDLQARNNRLPLGWAEVGQSIIDDLRYPHTTEKTQPPIPDYYYLALVCLDSPAKDVALAFLRANADIFERALSYERNEKSNRSVPDYWYKPSMGPNRPLKQDYAPFKAKSFISVGEKKEVLARFGLENGFRDFDTLMSMLEYTKYQVLQLTSFLKQEEIDLIKVLFRQFDATAMFMPSRTRCTAIDPLNRTLPGTLARKAKACLKDVLASSPEIRQRDPFPIQERVMNECILLAETMDTESKSDGLVWEQLRYLLENDIRIGALTAKTEECRRTLLEMTVVHDTSNEPKNTKQQQKKKKTTTTTNFKKSDDDQSTGKIKGACSIKPTLRLRDAGYVGSIYTKEQWATLADAKEYTTFFNFQRAEPSLISMKNVYFRSRLNPEQLKRCLQRYVHPCSWAKEGVDETLALVGAVNYHLHKHTQPGTPVEDYIGDCLAFYCGENNIKRVRETANAANPLKKVRYIYYDGRFATYTMEGKMITFCDRSKCPGDHYKGL